jgi:hypothetical protein
MGLIAPSLPENAPFSPLQRAWLDGFLAGLFVNGERVTAGTIEALLRHESRRIFRGMTRGCRSMSGSRSRPEGAPNGY